jgi:phosphotransferase system HPr (HPr) family protein
MSDNTVTTSVTINNPAGVHLRSAMEIGKLASRFQAQISLMNRKNQVRANASSSFLEIISLVAEQGDELLVEANGPDAQEAVDAIVDLIANHLDEYKS